jgi:GTPase
MKKEKMPMVVLIGRTNVGKSTLFNRLLENQKALVSSLAGTTRDRNEGVCLWRGKEIKIVDTGGLDVNPNDEIEQNIKLQAELAMKQADLILFVIDVKSGPLPQEAELAKMLQKIKPPVIVVGNKAEKPHERESVFSPEFKLQSLSIPMPVSAKTGVGVGDLLDEIYTTLESRNKHPLEPKTLPATKVAVIGKPNAGKSTFLNAISNEDRFITSAVAHTTREPNDTLVEYNRKRYIFIDTAGMRKKGMVKKAGGLEAVAVKRNERIIKQADITLLVIEANHPIGNQEKTLAGLLKGSGSGVIVVVNKWDLVEDKETNTMNEFREYFTANFPFLKWAPFVFVSALTKQRVKTVFKVIDEVEKNRQFKINQQELYLFLQRAISKHLPSKGKGSKPPKILGMKQIGSCPPYFEVIIKAKRTDVLNKSYLRFLENRLREEHKLSGTPIKMHVTGAKSVSD